MADDEAPGMAFPGRVVEVQYTRSGKSATYRIAGAGHPGGPGTVSAGSPVGGPDRPRARRRRRGGPPHGRVEELRIVAVGPDEAGRAAA